MAEDRDVKIRITAQNLSDPAFQAARANLASLGAEAGKVKTWSDVMVAGMSQAGKQASASGQMIAWMSQSGRESMASLTTSVTTATAAKQRWTSTVLGGVTAGMALSHVVMSAVSGLVSFTKGVFASAGSIVDLSQKTGLSTDAIQEMQYVATQTGTTMEAFTQAAYMLGIRLAGGSDSVKDALDDLHVSFTDIRNMRPEDQFQLIVQKLGDMDSETERNRLGVELFGRSFSGIAAAVGAGYEAMARDAKKSTTEQLQALDDFSDAAASAWAGFKAAATSALGTVVIGLRGLKNAFFDAATADAALDEAVFGTAAAAAELRTQQTRVTAAVQQAVPPVRSYGERLAEVKGEVARLTDAQRAEIIAAKQLGVDTDELTTRFGLNEIGLAMVTAESKTATKQHDDHVKAVKKTTEAYDRLMSEIRNSEGLLRMQADEVAMLTARMVQLERIAVGTLPPLEAVFDELREGPGTASPAFTALVQGFERTQLIAAGTVPVFERVFDELAQGPPAARLDLDRLGASFERLANIAGDSLGAVVRQIGVVIQSMAMAERAGEGMHAAWKQMGKPGQGMAGLQNLVGSGIEAFSAVSAATSTGSTGARAAGGAMAGLRAGAAFGPIGMGVGAGVGALVGFFRGRSAAKKEEKEVNELRQQFIEAAGGLAELQAKAEEADVSLTKLLAAKKAKDFEAAVQQVQTRLGALAADQAADSARLEEAIRKYGFAFEELGPKLRQQQLHEQATELISDWRVLVGAGVEIGDVNARMATSINEYLALALKTGAEVPVAMRPIMETMAEQGLLLDETGQKVTDVGDLHVSWAESLGAAMTKVVEKLQELIDRLQGAGQAINDIPSTKQIAISATVDVPDIGQYFRDQGYGGYLPGSGMDLGYVMHTGGPIVRRHGGGRIPRAHAGMAFGEPLADDEVPIIAQAGEYMLSRRHVRDLGGLGGVDRLLSAMATGGAGRGDTTPIALTVEVYLSQGADGRMRVLGESERRQIQDWFFGGAIQVPQRAVTAKAR